MPKYLTKICFTCLSQIIKLEAQHFLACVTAMYFAIKCLVLRFHVQVSKKYVPVLRLTQKCFSWWESIWVGQQWQWSVGLHKQQGGWSADTDTNLHSERASGQGSGLWWESHCLRHRWVIRGLETSLFIYWTLTKSMFFAWMWIK